MTVPQHGLCTFELLATHILAGEMVLYCTQLKPDPGKTLRYRVMQVICEQLTLLHYIHQVELSDSAVAEQSRYDEANKGRSKYGRVSCIPPRRLVDYPHRI